MRAGAALAENDLPTAELILRPILKRRPTDVAAIRMMAELAARVGRRADSENLLRRAIELAPGWAAPRANLANLLNRMHRSAEALAELDKISAPEGMICRVLSELVVVVVAAPLRCWANALQFARVQLEWCGWLSQWRRWMSVQ